MKCCKVATLGRSLSCSEPARNPLRQFPLDLHFRLSLILLAVWLPAAVQSQNNPFGLTTLSTRSVDTDQELSDAWADPQVRTALVEGELTIDAASWRDKFSATGGVAVLPQASDVARKNFTLAGAASDSPAMIHFQRLPYTFMVGSQGVLQIQNMVLYDIALSADYHYSPQQPYRAVIVGSDMWPTIGLAPGAVVKLINVSVAYRNTDPELSCEQRVSLSIYSLQQLRGKDVIKFKNSTAGRVPGKLLSNLKIVNGSNNSPLGEATIHIQNVTVSCLPTLNNQQLFGKLTASQFAVAVSVPIGVTVATLAVLALCIRRHSRKQPAAHGSSSTVLKDVESGLSQQFNTFSDSVCKRKRLSSNGTTDTALDEAIVQANSDKADHRLKDAAQMPSAGAPATALTDSSRLQVTSLDTKRTQSAAAAAAPVATPFAAARLEHTSTGTGTGISHEGAGLVDKPHSSVLSHDGRMLSTAISASTASTTSQPLPQSSVDAELCAGRVSSAALTLSSGNNSIQQQQSLTGSVTSPATSTFGQQTSGSIRSRRLSFEDYKSSNDSSSRHEAPSGLQALLKTRSDIAVLRDLKIGQLLGTGSYGRVYKGRWKSVAVAVKVMEHHSTTRGTTSSNATKLVMAGRETALAVSVAHPNVVQTYHISTMTASQRKTLARTWRTSSSFNKHHNRHGAALLAGDDDIDGHLDVDDDDDDVGSEDDDDDDVGGQKDALETWLIMEYCERGSLEKAIKGGELCADDGKPNMIGIYKALLDIASGLDYLHSMGVVHGDLKTANVLLKGSTRDVRGFACKITDFGISRVLEHDATHVSTKTHGTIMYMPKEVLLTGHMSQATDVYSFGLLMWELYAGCSVYEEDMSIGQLFYMIAYSDWRPDIASGCPPGYSDLMKACWHQDPEQRPTAQQLLKALQKLYVAAKQQAGRTSRSAPLAAISSRSQQQQQAHTSQGSTFSSGVSSDARHASADKHADRCSLRSRDSRDSQRCLSGSSRGSARGSQDGAGWCSTDSNLCCTGLDNSRHMQRHLSASSNSNAANAVSGTARMDSLGSTGGSAGQLSRQVLLVPVTYALGVAAHQQWRRRSADAVTSSSSSSRPCIKRSSFDVSSTELFKPSSRGYSWASSAAALQQGALSDQTAAGCSGRSTPLPKSPVLDSSKQQQQQQQQQQQRRRRVSFEGHQPKHLCSEQVLHCSPVLATQLADKASTLSSRANLGHAAAAAAAATSVGSSTNSAHAASSAAAASSAYSSDRSQSTLPQQQQQQVCQQQLCSYYQLLRNSFEQQPTLDNETQPSESLFATDNVQTTSTWQDYSSGGSTSRGLMLQDGTYFATQVQPQCVGLQHVTFPISWWQQQQQQPADIQAHDQQQQQPVSNAYGYSMLLKADGDSAAAAAAAQNFLEALELATRPSEGGQ